MPLRRTKCLLHTLGIAWVREMDVGGAIDEIEQVLQEGVFEMLGGLALTLGILG
jgi:hypothetical protein